MPDNPGPAPMTTVPGAGEFGLPASEEESEDGLGSGSSAHLAGGAWSESGRGRNASGTASVSHGVHGPAGEGRVFAISTMESWAAIGGLAFAATSGSARIAFDDDGAQVGYGTASASVEAGNQRPASSGAASDAYPIQTSVHEIGHVLGLGHAEDHNGSAGWSAQPGGDPHGPGAPSQASATAYVGRDASVFVDRGHASIVAPKPAEAEAGGVDPKAASHLDVPDVSDDEAIAFTIFDGGGGAGDASRLPEGQRIDPSPAASPDGGGDTGSPGLAPNTAIGDEIAGGSDDPSRDAGADVLRELAGADTLHFAATPGAGHVDRIRDVSAPHDTIELDGSIFTELSTGLLPADAFKDLADGPADASDRILYDSGTGALLYDADGAGGAAAVQFATLSNTPKTLSHLDFLVVA